MGLRGRLALFFLVITVVPLAIALVGLQGRMDRDLEEHAAGQLAAAEQVLTVQLGLMRSRAGDLSDELVRLGAAGVLVDGDPAAAQQWLDAREVGARADAVVLVAADGSVLAERRDPGAFSPGVEAPAAAVIAEGARTRMTPIGTLVEVRELLGGPPDREERLGWLASVIWLDEDLLGSLALFDGAAVVDGDLVRAVTGAGHDDLVGVDLPGSGQTVTVELPQGPVLARSVAIGPLLDAGEDRLVVWTEQDLPPATRFLPLLLAPAALVAALLGWLLAGTVVSPVRRAAEVARAVAAGDLERKLEPRGGRELADLAGALNTMSNDLRHRLEQLERSRDQLRGSLSRLGETLSSSLDLNRTLAVVVETAMDTLGADRAALQLLTPEREALYTKVGRGIGDHARLVRLGEGVTGWVAETGMAVRLPADAEQLPSGALAHLNGTQELAVPMVGRGQVIGVLSLVRDEPDPPFAQADLETIRSFAAQASVAIENVMLHREAQRLSVTDTLTGLWNLRYFQMQATRELDSAARFGRPASLLIIDIDNFKPVNDRYGHPVGDEVLAEIARRIRDSTRVPDVVARYGGEEFVVLLPDTDLEGGLATAERIRAHVAAQPVALQDAGPAGGIQITCSVGVSTFGVDGTTLAVLLRCADAAMYAAKTAGRNRVASAHGQ